MGEDERILALREVAEDRCEHSGWVKLTQGALDVIGEALSRAEKAEAERDEARSEKFAALQRLDDPHHRRLGSEIRRREAAEASLSTWRRRAEKAEAEVERLRGLCP